MLYGPTACSTFWMLLIYYSFNRRTQPTLNALISIALSSLRATYGLMASPYLTPVVIFIQCSFVHLTTTCSTSVFYRCTVENFLTGSSAADRTLTLHTHTDNIACWVICWSLSLCSVQCPLLSLSLYTLPPLCSGNDCPRSPYSLTSERCSSQSLLPFQPSAVPTILQWMSTAIKLQPSLHPRCCSLSPTFPQSQPHYRHRHLCRPVNIYILLCNVPL
jgi:hypothetical protein